MYSISSTIKDEKIGLIKFNMPDCYLTCICIQLNVFSGFCHFNSHNNFLRSLDFLVNNLLFLEDLLSITTCPCYDYNFL